MNDADFAYRQLLIRLLNQGSHIEARNGPCRRLFAEKITFSHTPLISLRRVAWRTALREWEWFMSGSNRLEDLHPSVRHWWERFCTVTPDTLHYNYGVAFRRIYCPDVSRVVLVERKEAGGQEESERPALIDPAMSGKSGPLTGQEFKSKTLGLSYRVLDVVGSKFSSSVYRIQFLHTGYVASYVRDYVKSGDVKDVYAPTVYGVGWRGEPYPAHPAKDRAYKVWLCILERCYAATSKSYRNYGAVGVRVCARWLCFANFLHDLSRLPGYEEWYLNPGEYEIDKDYYGGASYGPGCCVFLPTSLNLKLAGSVGKLSLYRGEELVQEFITWRDLSEFTGVQCRPSRELPRKLMRQGYRVECTLNTEKHLWRYPLIVDQVGNVLRGLVEQPYSRRHVLTTWVPGHAHSGLMNPANCHGTEVQFFTEPPNILNMTMYQRSADVMVGVVANWLQYWAFLLWSCHRSGRIPGTFTWIGGDVHLYDTHTELARKVVAQQPTAKVPELVYRPTSEDFKADDFSLDGEYRPALEDRAEMVV